MKIKKTLINYKKFGGNIWKTKNMWNWSKARKDQPKYTGEKICFIKNGLLFECFPIKDKYVSCFFRNEFSSIQPELCAFLGTVFTQALWNEWSRAGVVVEESFIGDLQNNELLQYVEDNCSKLLWASSVPEAQKKMTINTNTFSNSQRPSVQWMRGVTVQETGY